MNEEILQSSVTLVQIIMLLFLITLTARNIFLKKSNIISNFFYIFALASLLVSDLYWFVFELIRPDVRMPFAANEFGEVAGFLLLASALKSCFRDYDIPGAGYIIVPAVFTAANVALWIGWSGEWLQDIISGLSLGYMICICVFSMKMSNAMNRTEWVVFTAVPFILVLMETLTFFVPENYKTVVDTLCYIIMAVSIVSSLIWNIAYILRKKDNKQLLALAFSVQIWITICMYMSAGGWYIAFTIAAILILPFTYNAIRREVPEE